MVIIMCRFRNGVQRVRDFCGLEDEDIMFICKRCRKEL